MTVDAEYIFCPEHSRLDERDKMMHSRILVLESKINKMYTMLIGSLITLIFNLIGIVTLAMKIGGK